MRGANPVRIITTEYFSQEAEGRNGGGCPRKSAQPHLPMFGSFFAALYFCAIIGASVYLIVLAIRMVRASEKIAAALDKMANNRPDPR